MAKPPPPPPRKTMTAERPSGKKPPRMPGAAVTEPPRPNTIDVQMEWIELVDENGNVVKKLTEKK